MTTESLKDEVSRLNRMLEGLYFKDKSSVSFEVLKEKDVADAAVVFARVFVTREVLASCLNITILDMIPIAKALCHLCTLEKLRTTSDNTTLSLSLNKEQ